jgi:DNA-binding NtrC family response regulator
MSHRSKKILIIDEAGFSRICSAILEQDGYRVATITSINTVSRKFSDNDFGLIITSYPYGVYFLREIQKRDLPVAKLVLADQFSSGLFTMLDGLNNSCCMVKPLDYAKFRSLVKDMVCGDLNFIGGYNIV